MMNDFQGAPPHERIAAEHLRLQPFAGDLTEGKDFAPHDLVDGGIGIHQNADQRCSLALSQRFTRFRADERLHILSDRGIMAGSPETYTFNVCKSPELLRARRR